MKTKEISPIAIGIAAVTKMIEKIKSTTSWKETNIHEKTL